MSDFAKIFVAGLAGYLLGSVSFSIILSRVRYRDDIRRHGSGNAGMTNILRTYGKASAVLVLLGDAAKGALAGWLGWQLGGEAGMYFAGLLAVIGHMFPVFFGFRGGKGVATGAGFILMSRPLLFLLLVAVFLAVVFLSRYVSLGSITVAGIYLLASLYLHGGPTVWHAALCPFLMAALVIWAHRSNIKRLLTGRENKLGKK